MKEIFVFVSSFIFYNVTMILEKMKGIGYEE